MGGLKPPIIYVIFQLYCFSDFVLVIDMEKFETAVVLKTGHFLKIWASSTLALKKKSFQSNSFNSGFIFKAEEIRVISFNPVVPFLLEE